MFAPSSHKPWLAALHKCTSVMNDLGIPYALDGGTIIGFARDGTFVRYDKDLDITLLEQQKRLPELARGLKEAGFRNAIVRAVNDSTGTQKLVPRARDARIDIVNKRERDGMAYWCIYGSRTRVKSVPASFYENLGTIVVDGISFSVPQELEAYLVTRWGRSWRTPVMGPNYKRYSMDRAYPSARNERRFP